MYLFTRRARLGGGKISDAIGWAAGINERVNAASGLEVSMWTPAYSPGVGTVTWATFVPDLVTLEKSFDILTADDGYNQLVDRGAEFVVPGTVEDTLDLILYGSQPDPDRHVSYVAVVRSTMKAGGLSRGITLGIEIAEKAKQITGMPTAFLASATGNYGGVAWITSFTDAAELERAQMALNSDPSFVELIDNNAGSVYTDHPGATTQTIHRRIA